ncbi:hypothetical protein DCS_07915 [Drechmeria coniospora]|uniref:TATA element modulatory factor 1 TATA binding domain-containing protein n=1 Tax=Drechmeria coniospora TaxID=98403 RepID=A0A151GFS1_DRECN|nr:hypothetical protein DCS_07915 [Drechmeria coniospora]KYK55950.1 hypothetical protein DCS_07915 [Drechmeria coniospora]
MAAPAKQSRWGSFLSQTVAGVESRLDNILADADDSQQQPAPVVATASSSNNAEPVPSSANSLPASSSRANDRLQARLAKAMIAKSAAGGTSSKDTNSPRSSADVASRPSTDDKARLDQTGPVAADSGSIPPPKQVEVEAEPSSTTANADGNRIDRLANDTPTSDVNRGQDTPSELSASGLIGGGAAGPKATERTYEISDSAVEEMKARHQDEIQDYVERVDSLESKLQYLAKSTADSAKRAASSASPSGLERKIAERDEKIALLLQEGQALSSTEQKLRASARKLRVQMSELEKQTEELRKDRDKAVSNAEELRNRLDVAEGSEMRQAETRRVTAALQQEIEELKTEHTKKDEAYQWLEQESKAKSQQVEAANAEALSRALAGERAKHKELDETIAALRAEKESQATMAKQVDIEWRERLERAVERGSKVEEELKMELRTMESRLEAMRTAAEEASSGSGGEAQVKMFRQIETLQSQYASARENWQGMESSLLAKAANLEKEKDEALRRESEMRKKARDAAIRNRHLEDEVSAMQPALATARQELEAVTLQLATMKTASRDAEEALEQARKDLNKEKRRLESRDDGAEAERRQWADDVAGATSRGHPTQHDSPTPLPQRTFSSDFMAMGLPALSKPRRTPTYGSIPDSPAEVMSPIRRLSCQPPGRLSIASTVGYGQPLTPFSPFEAPSESQFNAWPSAVDRENGADEEVPSSPRNIAHDMISVSTATAGPSVQLVERMSAAIRRLEGEKVAAKEEMARVCHQRDEALADLVNLMKELEEANAAAKSVPELEGKVSDLDSRYQTTLEMLGEKSELVEELKADVQDVKAMYRELVERTVT